MYLAGLHRLFVGVMRTQVSPPGAWTGVRVGVDLVTAGDVAASVARFGDRYLRRVFTEHELSSCAGDPDRVAEGLAARFAAKEATLKVLGLDGAQPGWRSIEVFRTPRGWCELRLQGPAARLADEEGIGQLAVSLSHDRGVAMAVVVALTNREETRSG
jgi:holo-[acyl-carrier protein] synthase